MRINHNISALSAFNVMKDTGKKLDGTIQALSTGFQINSAADDEAGMEISESMRAQISGLDTALENAQDGISLLQTAEGALQDTTGMLHRMRELSVQAATGTLTQQDREHIQKEIDQLKKEIDRTAHTTQFNKKKLLNGETGLEWSASELGVRAYITGENGGNAEGDFEGNYQFDVSVDDAGQGQVQKTNIFSIQHAESYLRYEEFEINIVEGTDTLGETSGKGWTFDDGGFLHITGDGTYSVIGTLDASGGTIATGHYIKVDGGVKATIIIRDVHIEATKYAFDMVGADVDLWIDPGDHDNENIFRTNMGGPHSSAIQASEGSTLTISSMKGDYQTAGKLRAEGSTHGAGIGGSCYAVGGGASPAGDITIFGGTITAIGGEYGAGIGGGSAGGSLPGHSGNITINGGIVTATGGVGGAGIGSGSGVSAGSNYPNEGTIKIRGGTVTATGGEGNAYTGKGAAIGGGGGVQGGTITIQNGLDLTVDGFTDAEQTEPIGHGERASSADVTYKDMKRPAARETPEKPKREISSGLEMVDYELSEIEQFYTDDGRFLLDDAQKLTITQGDGKTASVMLYASDTMRDVAAKINDAISVGLGQSKYLTKAEDNNNFCNIARGGFGTSESVVETADTGATESSTLLVRSVVAGKAGELSFSGSQEMLNVLGLNTVQSSKEATYKTTIREAHSGEIVAKDVKTTGSKLHGIIAPHIDVEFDAMKPVAAKWDDKDKKYVLGSAGTYSFDLHLKDNSVKLQTGAYEGDRFSISIGNMTASALGLDGVNVSSQEAAVRSLTMIDGAIDKVSSQRAKLGASQNTLEHITEKLRIESRNMNEAESRIRDADMARMMMKFTKLNIRLQATNSVFTQANQTPQQVLSLMR
ncbi:MAG: hypothetical protein IJT02_08660 [Synergistaceae bacterium]|nr:hypothetical protein [Synergistaceae bacterium]